MELIEKFVHRMEGGWLLWSVPLKSRTGNKLNSEPHFRQLIMEGKPPMSGPTDGIKRWTARRKAAVVMEIIKDKITAADVISTEKHGTSILPNRPC